MGGLRGFVFAQLIIAAMAVMLLWSPSASARIDSSIVIEADSGHVLSEHNADIRSYPASLTKMMTLYLVFEALEHGKFKLTDQLPVSERAAHQAPSRLGLEEGETVAVRDLILGLITKSANDAAVVAAEGLAGSEAAFAEHMTEKAHALGMTSTTFRNASGLPNPAQRTTARDIATLARALYRDFPREYAYFATEEFTYQGVTYSNHNHLMSAYEGMDGIKTGYIRAAGFNLAASAVRGDRRLIGVVMGGRSPHARDMQMAQLLNRGFTGTDGTEPVLTAKSDEEEEDNDNSLSKRAARTLAALSPISRAEAAPADTPRPLHPHEGRARWSIQVGAFAQKEAAQKAAAAALASLHRGRGKSIEVLPPSETDKEKFYRARIVNLTEREAEKACRVRHRKHKDCAVMLSSHGHGAAPRV